MTTRSAIPNRLMLELSQTYNPFKEEIFKKPSIVKKGNMDLPGRPGSGMELKLGLPQRCPYLPAQRQQCCAAYCGIFSRIGVRDHSASVVKGNQAMF